jgi:medium-chain acyl-[acyl-carrier-protein] hydrolase
LIKLAIDRSLAIIRTSLQRHTAFKMTRETVHSRWVAGNVAKPNAKLRLFCFPYAGGSTSTFKSWQEGLPDSVEVSAVQLPGRGGRLSEAPFQHLPEMVEALAGALSPLFDKPFAFFGHSMGALIGLELCRWLRRERDTMPVHLFVSGRRAPQLPELESPTYNLPESEFVQRLRILNGTPQGVLDHPELMQLMIPLLRADFSVCETYEYRTELPLNCPLTVFGGIQDVEVPHEQLQAWREHTKSTFSLRMFPGDHFFLNPAQPDILRIIAQHLADAV